MPKHNDYYAILKVLRDASEDEIRKSYRDMFLKYDPDKNLDNRTATVKLGDMNCHISTITRVKRTSVVIRVIRDLDYAISDRLCFLPKITLQKTISLCYYYKRGAHKRRYNEKYAEYHKVERITNCTR